MNKVIDNFTRRYKHSQTLKFELRPVGKTLENWKKSDLLETDFTRNKAYPEMKKFLDSLHKEFLERALSGCTIEWNDLAEAIQQRKEDPKNQEFKKALENKQKDKREKIVAVFKSEDCKKCFEALTKDTPKDLFKNLGVLFPGKSLPNEDFKGFACYFKGYQENRKNIYSDKAQQTAAAHRAVNENFSKFFQIVEYWGSLQKDHPTLAEKIKAEVEEDAGIVLSDYLKITNYNAFLPQSGIDGLNKIIGKINYEINQYKQETGKKISLWPVLYKQILSDRESGWRIEAIQNNDELKDAVRNYLEGIKAEDFEKLREKFCQIDEAGDLFISASEFSKISHSLLGRWNAFAEAREEYVTNTYRKQKDKKAYLNRDEYLLSEINEWKIMKTLPEGESPVAVKITDYWTDQKITELFRKEKDFRGWIADTLENIEDIRNDEDTVACLKEYFDTVLEILHYLKPLNISLDLANDYQRELIEEYERLSPVIGLYNQIRNFVTQKPSEESKIKLMFNKPTLADGWDKNQEDADRAVILRTGSEKNEKYYLGIINPKCKIKSADIFKNSVADSNEACYQKMEYKLLPGPSKMLPKVCFAERNKELYAPSKDLVESYNNGEHTKGRNFNLDFCHELIEFFKKSIEKNAEWSVFNFQFSPTSSYKDISQFYHEVEVQGYNLKFVNIPETDINKAVEEGKLFLFQIWNKDFSEHSTGTANKSTLYWQAIFDEKNLKDVVFKLNGEAELFLRKASVPEKKATHPKNSKLVNKTIVKDTSVNPARRESIPAEIYEELLQFANDKRDQLSDKAKKLWAERVEWVPGMGVEATLNRVVVKDAKYDLIKDKRFTEDKYFFHVPFIINFTSPSPNGKDLNKSVQDILKTNPSINIIGIDRGERNLIRVVCIDQNGNIRESRNFNKLNGFDYHNKLSAQEKERDAARKSWKQIGKIKDLKAGYLSGVIYEIARMMVEYNAIVVLEDLNRKFIRSRFGFEKQVYQKFEKALIDKLQYLVFKKKSWDEPGGLLNGYQLTNKFESFQKMTNQSGWLFYVPAEYTSVIDPVTGFASFFTAKEIRYDSVEKSREFFRKFSEISYCRESDLFRFSFDYKKIGVKFSGKKDWTVYSYGKRIAASRQQGTWRYEDVDVTAELKELFKRYNIELNSSLKDSILDQTQKDFWQKMLWVFKLIVQLRNSRPNSTEREDDYILSPVMDKNGKFFNSIEEDEKNGIGDADTNGAYNIARKGLLKVRNLKSGSKKNDQEAWFKYIQENPYLKKE